MSAGLGPKLVAGATTLSIIEHTSCGARPQRSSCGRSLLHEGVFRPSNVGVAQNHADLDVRTPVIVCGAEPVASGTQGKAAFRAGLMTHSILLSFDVEEFDSPHAAGQRLSLDDQVAVTAQGLESLMPRLNEVGCSATFFTTAQYAEQDTERMRVIAQRHEIASHGYFHARFEDAHLASSRDVLQRLTGHPILGFRRARLQHTDHDAITAAGYLYNSSENPIWLPGRYNNLRRPRGAYRSGELINIPISASPRLRIPLFWLAFKNLPETILRRAAARALREDRYLNLFFHPWEFTDLHPWRLPWYVKRHGGEAMLDRLSRFLEWLAPQGTFQTMGNFAQAHEDFPVWPGHGR